MIEQYLSEFYWPIMILVCMSILDKAFDIIWTIKHLGND